MAALYNRVPLAAILWLAIGRLASADAINMPGPESVASFEADTAFPQFSRLPLHEPPLRLALALTRERQHTTPQLRESAQEFPAVQLTAQTRPLRSAPLARLQDTDIKPEIKLEEQAGSDDAFRQKTQEMAIRDAARTWDISPGDGTLNTVFGRWSASAGWQLVWELEVDYPIQTRAVLEGTFEEAVAAVAESLANASVPIQATFYAGNKVLRIVAKGSK